MNFYNFSIIISIIIGILIILKIRSYDVYEKEPFIAMMLAFILGGAASIFFCTMLYLIPKYAGIDSKTIETVYGSFFIIGPIEEFSKFLGFIAVYPFLKKQMNEITDGVVYISCVALGFSIIENFSYANTGIHNEHLIILRAFISTPAHISFSCLIGYAFYRYKKEQKPFSIIIWAILIASFLHGFYDAIIFAGYISFILIFYLWAILNQSLMIVQLTNIISPFRPKFVDLFISSSNETVNQPECPYCKSKEHKEVYKNSFFTSFKCDTCGYHISSLKDLKRIFKYFAPEYKDLRKEIYPVELPDGKVYKSIYACTYFKKGSKFGFYKIEDVDQKLVYLNRTIIDKFYSSKIVPVKYLAKILD